MGRLWHFAAYRRARRDGAGERGEPHGRRLRPEGGQIVVEVAVFGEKWTLLNNPARGLVAVMDWYSRKVLAWRLSNTLNGDFCVEAVEDALAHFGSPEIFNTDQGAQFTGSAFTEVLKGAGVAISMDGKGRWVDNVFVQRLWRSVKYEEVYLHAYESVAAARAGLGRYFRFYNAERRHQGLGRRTPDAVYADSGSWPEAA